MEPLPSGEKSWLLLSESYSHWELSDLLAPLWSSCYNSHTRVSSSAYPADLQCLPLTFSYVCVDSSLLSPTYSVGTEHGYFCLLFLLLCIVFRRRYESRRLPSFLGNSETQAQLMFLIFFSAARNKLVMQLVSLLAMVDYILPCSEWLLKQQSNWDNSE